MKERRAITIKKKLIEEISDKLKKYKTYIIIDLRQTPDKLLQSIRTMLKKEYNAYMKVAKLVVVKKALEKMGIPSNVYEDIDFPCAVIGINEAPYTVAELFRQNMLKVPAKPGSTANEDIVVEAGPTDIPPGPALSQLKQAGIDVKIEKGKITVSKDSVVVRKGEKVTPQKAQALQMLGLKPFKVGITIHKAYADNLVFTKEVLDITKESIMSGIHNAFMQAFNASINANYPTQANIEALLSKEVSNAMNVAINAGIYTPQYIKELLQKALIQGNALKQLEGG